jgi:hypothetical protein
MPEVPHRQVCKLCAHDDEVTMLPIGDGSEWAFTCTATTGHSAPYVWTVKVERGMAGREGITAELGLYDDLPRCVRVGDPWIEHGILEHRYKLLRPDVYFDELLPRYGHVALKSKRYTTSVFIASALGQLMREGALAWQYAPATGLWNYNHKISFWALPPAPPLEERLTWAEFAGREGLDSKVWDVTPPRPKHTGDG